MKRLFKENKVLFVLLAIILISFVIIVFGLIKYFYLGNGSSTYGTRLNDISEHKLNSNLDKDIKNLFTENPVNDVTVDLKGKIIYLTIDLSELINLNDAKTLAIKSLDALGEDEKNYYDIQFIITAKEVSDENSLYPTMGYKAASSSQIVWIKE